MYTTPHARAHAMRIPIVYCVYMCTCVCVYLCVRCYCIISFFPGLQLRGLLYTRRSYVYMHRCDRGLHTLHLARLLHSDSHSRVIKI